MARQHGFRPWEKAAAKKTVLLYRAKEAISFLMECNGHTPLTQGEFATALQHRFGNAWSRQLLKDVMTLTRDQDIDEEAREELGGYVISYAPNFGGLTLLDPTGEMPLDSLLHMLSGDIQRQQVTKTVNRRRLNSWRAAAQNAMRSGDFDLGAVLNKIENEIERTGFASDSLVDDFLKVLSAREIPMELEEPA